MSVPNAVGRLGGFTLIELVVALALISLMSLLILQAIHLGSRTWEMTTRSAADMDSIATLQQSLRHRINQLIPLQHSASTTCGGTSSRLDFLAPAPGDEAHVPTASFHLEVASRQGSPAVSIRWTPDLDGTLAISKDAFRGDEILLDHLASASLRYLGRDTRQWSEAWTDCRHPPALIALNVQFPPGDHRRWPPFAAHPFLDVGADCEFDPVSERCRP